MKNIVGLADGRPEAKADWVLGKAAQGYNNFYFADDAYKNVKAVQDVLNVITEFHHSLYSTSWVDDQIVLDLPINAEPFTARFDNELTGWTATINVQVHNKNNLCIVPIDPNS